MKVNNKKFVDMIVRECASVLLFCMEFGITVGELRKMLLFGIPFDYEQSERLVSMFGASAMAAVIDWEGMNVRCPI